ncbi:lysis system i-spanin subunit Rz [Roseateles sp. SL47]|uniref:lysis system i-spanin subunit Rz n=1 Tax=Roseateles sp. SL47 TaxID=2995138 RepID=UPI00226D835C|nr:lysis system i-spanin subunit Rz [Roseateles sp. SL47]WAC70808.1 lysis system i-spanin subunit Rz [Roseateles sp. SL47]
MKRKANTLLLIASALIAFWLGELHGQMRGSEAERQAADLREQAMSAQQAAAQAAQNQRYRATEAAMRDELAAAMQSFSRTIANEKDQHDRLVAGLRSGNVRVSVPIVAPSPTCTGQASGDPSLAAGAGHEARAELAPAAAADLDAIATDGNAAILQLNAVIDRYNAVKKQLDELAGHAQAQ